ncbi:MAG: hypothetical protein PHP51_01280 [Desulfotomaculaceae bacterium]|nr:hypothetical protein [Desulfotomaculaceae bacterium]MDD4766570.1 hypothetical protein [Desulfotomaculaceae bacterium]
MDESFFKLLMFAGEGDENLDELIEMGYFKKIDGTICRTNKFLAETGRFIDDKKESVYQAVQELGSAEDMDAVMGKAGIKDFITFIFVTEELVGDGKLVKDKEKNVVPRQ